MRFPGVGITVLLLGLALGAAGCGKDRKREIGALKSEIEAGNARLAEAVAHRDVAAIGECFASDAQAYPPGSSPVAGRAAIQDMWKGILGMSVGRIELRTVEVDGNGETAWETGRYTLVGVNGTILDDGKTIAIWKRELEGWKLYRDMWSSNSPQQALPSGQPAAGR